MPCRKRLFRPSGMGKARTLFFRSTWSIAVETVQIAAIGFRSATIPNLGSANAAGAIVDVSDRSSDYLPGGAFIEEMGFCPGAERPTVK